MLSKFKEYHKFNESEYNELWVNCLFILDTNALLNMYRYSQETVSDFFNYLEKLKEKKQLWIPHQIGFEFYENRLNVICELNNSYDKILKFLEQAKSKISNDINQNYQNHPLLDLKQILSDFDNVIEKNKTIIKEKKQQHPNWLENDVVLDRIEKLFDNIVGDNFDEKKINDIKKLGDERYKNKIPPGFKDDKDKGYDTKYGDLILWFQIIEKAKIEQKPIVFVTGENKPDWWLIIDGKKLMPLPKLKKEIFDEAGVLFHIYNTDSFLEYSKIRNSDIKDLTISEIRKVRENDEFSKITNFDYDFDIDITKELNKIVFKKLATLLSRIIDNEYINLDNNEISDPTTRIKLLMLYINKELNNDKISNKRIQELLIEIKMILLKLKHAFSKHDWLNMIINECLIQVDDIMNINF